MRLGKPVVAIVGRPNVGKSTLFNMIAGERISIVKDTPGVTRDRIYADVSWLNYSFTIMDTGGIEPVTKNQMLKSMREQAMMAIEMADVVMFVVDVRQGLTDSDSKVADMLRKAAKKVVLVVNKVDNFEKYMPDVYEFYNLGIGEPFPVSSIGKLGIGDMLDEVTSLFPGDIEEEEDERPRVAVVGKPNAGKSSIINCIVGRQMLETGELSRKVERGRHTTRNVEIFDIGYGIRLADTCGFSVLELENMNPDELSTYFTDFDEFACKCKYNGCNHINEPDCAVKKAVQQGELSKDRYDRYVVLYNDLLEKWRKRYD